MASTLCTLYFLNVVWYIVVPYGISTEYTNSRKQPLLASIEAIHKEKFHLKHTTEELDKNILILRFHCTSIDSYLPKTASASESLATNFKLVVNTSISKVTPAV